MGMVVTSDDGMGAKAGMGELHFLQVIGVLSANLGVVPPPILISACPEIACREAWLRPAGCSLSPASGTLSAATTSCA